jgi:hypothetical protein
MTRIEEFTLSEYLPKHVGEIVRDYIKYMTETVCAKVKAIPESERICGCPMAGGDYCRDDNDKSECNDRIALFGDREYPKTGVPE